MYGDLLANASWFEYLYLLFKLERPEQWQAQMLEKVAIAIANPGIRDHSVRAAMCAGVGGSTSAASLMAALSVGGGQLNGAREVYLMMDWWKECGLELSSWQEKINSSTETKRASVWTEIEHVPGFDPNGTSCTQAVLQTLKLLADIRKQGALIWLIENRQEI